MAMVKLRKITKQYRKHWLLSMITTNTTNGLVITDAIKLVQTNKEKLMSKEDGKESKKPDYEEVRDQLEEEKKEDRRKKSRNVSIDL